MMTNKRATLLLALAIVSASAPAHAHLVPTPHGSFTAGAIHPMLGLDHVLAMTAVGVWAALIGGRIAWLMPASFVAAMLAGFGAALAGLGLPHVEATVLASVIILGLLLALTTSVPVLFAVAAVAFFAAFHGYAHGVELGAAAALPFATGFALATTLLHGAGILLCHALASVSGPDNEHLLGRIIGGATAAGGLALALT